MKHEEHLLINRKKEKIETKEIKHGENLKLNQFIKIRKIQI